MPVFSALPPQKPDALLALIALHRADTHPGKIDIGVGVYRNDAGETPVMRAVKAAERMLVTQQPSKSYLGAEGDTRFTDLAGQLVFGASTRPDTRFGIQTPGGTGALRAGAALLARALPDARVWISQPTWPNHTPIFADAGMPTITHPYFDASSGGIAFDAMLDALAEARANDVILLHGCCHNPTGTQFTTDQWQALAALCASRGLIPFVDLAYQGLGDGLEADSAGARMMVEAVPAALLAYSCDKNFGLYRDRVGALFVQAETPALTQAARANVLALARSLWSMPPDHGAAVVRMILDDEELRRDWRGELDAMRARLLRMRSALAAAHPLLAPIAHQRGLFSRLPITTDAVEAMRDRQSIYMPADGRINIAGLNDGNLQRFIDGLLPHLDGRESAQPQGRALPLPSYQETCA